MKINGDNSGFCLKSTSSEFTQRQKTVFEQLGAIETNINISGSDAQMDTNEEEIDCSPTRSSRSITKHYRGKESIFKKPQNPVPRSYINRMPDFKKNPHKWIKYSLDDVRDDDISERSNTNAAMSFLKELKDRKERDTKQTAALDVLTDKIIFKRHLSEVKPVEENPQECKPSFTSSKLVMPEYVVGCKSKKEKKNQGIKRGTQKELKLDHLQYIDED